MQPQNGTRPTGSFGSGAVGPPRKLNVSKQAIFDPLATGLTGQEESLAEREFPVSERLLMIVAAIHGALLDDGRSAIAAVGSARHRRPV